jgi:hypothetical protein
MSAAFFNQNLPVHVTPPVGNGAHAALMPDPAPRRGADASFCTG